MRRRFTLLLLLIPFLAWVFFGLAGGPLSARLAARFGPQILARSDEKFTDVQRFVHGRLREGAVLATAACLLLLAQHGIARAARRLPPPGRWVVLGWSAFLGLNILVAVAGHTVLFWSLLFTGKEHTHNFTQWNIKRNLMAEIEAPGQAVLLGASQIRTQIDTKVLNARLGQRLWTTELHFPGSSPYDMILCLERLPKVKLEYIITYFSEVSLNAGPEDERLPFFFGFRDLPSYGRLGPGKPALGAQAVAGLLGDAFPLYRDWEPLAGRMHGWKVQNAAQQRYDATLQSDLALRAEAIGKSMHIGPGWAFQKQAFATFARLCRERHSRLVICCGQLNPLLGHAIEPALRAEMVSYLRALAQEDAGIILLEENQMPVQTAADYDDLTHVNAEARERFSRYMAGTLAKLTAEKAPFTP